MNANENFPKTNPRLNRIRIVSRIVKWVIFVLGSFSIIFVLLFSSLSVASSSKINIWHALFLLSFQIVICLWYWKLTRLFHFYEQGLIFCGGNHPLHQASWGFVAGRLGIFNCGTFFAASVSSSNHNFRVKPDSAKGSDTNSFNNRDGKPSISDWIFHF